MGEILGVQQAMVVPCSVRNVYLSYGEPCFIIFRFLKGKICDYSIQWNLISIFIYYPRLIDLAKVAVETENGV